MHPAHALNHKNAAAVNLLLVTSFVIVGAWTLWLLPAYVLPHRPRLAWSLVPVVLLTTTWWSVIHEAIHGLLFKRRPLNNAAGRLLCILFGLPFQPVAFGHLFHHRRNRSLLDRAEIFTRDEFGPLAVAGYYGKLLGGLYIGEFALCFAAWLPRRVLRRLAVQRFVKAQLPQEGRLMETSLLPPATLWGIRVDSLCVLSALGLSLWLYGADAWMLVLVLLGRALLVSILDNAYHYGTPLDRLRYAFNMRLPKLLSTGILHFNLHRIHHLHPASPWWRLPALFDAAQDGYDGGYLILTLRQLRGPIVQDS